MKLLPHVRFCFRTNDPPDLVAARLATMVAVGWFFFKSPREPFRGSISNQHFKVVRVLGTFLGLPFHNSFQPVIVGDIVPVPDGSEVRVRMRLHALVAVFMTVWVGGLFCAAGLLVRDGLREGVARYCRAGNEFAGVGVGLGAVGLMLLFGYGLMSALFWIEVNRARLILRDLELGRDATVISPPISGRTP